MTNRAWGWAAVVITACVVVALGLLVGIELARDDGSTTVVVAPESGTAQMGSQPVSEDELLRIALALGPAADGQQTTTGTTTSGEPAVVVRPSDIEDLVVAEQRRARQRALALAQTQATAEAGAELGRTAEQVRTNAQVRQQAARLRTQLAALAGAEEALRAVRLAGARQVQLERQRQVVLATYSTLRQAAEAAIVQAEASAAGEEAALSLAEISAELQALEVEIVATLAAAAGAAEAGDAAEVERLLEELNGMIEAQGGAPQPEPPPSGAPAG